MNRITKETMIFFSKKYFILLLVVIAIICSSCYEDVIDIDLSEIDSQIVIEGNITDRPGPYRVKISKTASLYQVSSIRQVSDAIVVISDDTGYSETLEEIDAGIYQTGNLRGIPGRNYILSVIVEGKEYSAVSKMPEPIVFDSIIVRPLNQYYLEFELSAYFTDRVDVDDYCRVKFYRNGDFLDDDQILYHDKFTDGELIAIDNLITIFSLNDIVDIQLLTIEKEIYEYFSVLHSVYESEDTGDTDIIEFASANPRSNISNNALGYFSAHTHRNYRVFIR